jgi:hypothetical protein
MRPVLCASGTVLCVFSVLCGADLTVVLDFEATHSARSVAEMKAETEKLLRASGVSVDWRTTDGFVTGESFPKLAVVKFKGQCELTRFAPPAPESGAPLGFTYRIDGRITPFSEVECDRVRGTLGEAHITAAAEERDLLYGRALGRVLAHELFHILSGSNAHAKHGVMQRCLSAAELVGDRM